jgi:hypothetical protein
MRKIFPALIGFAWTFGIALSGPSSAQQSLRIGVSLSITGKQYSVQGGYGREGYLLCQKDVNAQGGVLRRSIEFVIYDDGSDEKTAARNYEKLITEDKVDAVLGPYGSAITEAVADVTEKHRKLMIAPMAATTSIWEKGRRYLIMMLAPVEGLSEGLLDLAARNGLKTVAVIKLDGEGHAMKDRIALFVIVILACQFSPSYLARTSADQIGVASVYSVESGRRTASGQELNREALTAAHRTLPLGTKVKVTNKSNGQSVVVTINDRGPFVRGRIIDVSPAAARVLGFSGLTHVTVNGE